MHRICYQQDYPYLRGHRKQKKSHKKNPSTTISIRVIVILLLSVVEKSNAMITKVFGHRSHGAASFHGSFLPSYRLLCVRQDIGVREYGMGGQSSRSILMMPEGPEVRTVVEQVLQPSVVGKRLMRIEFLKGGRYSSSLQPPEGYPMFTSTLSPWNDDTPTTNRSKQLGHEYVDIIQECNCKGKFIYIILDNGKHNGGSQTDSNTIPLSNTNDKDYQRCIFITLGMSGMFVSEETHRQRKGKTPSHHQHARWYFELMDVSSSSNTMTRTRIYFYDARNFGHLKFCFSRLLLKEKLESLGLDVLHHETTEDVFLALLQKQKSPMNICKFLMNQQKLSGIGNYLLAEVLYRARIDPFCHVQELSLEQQQKLFHEIKATAMESYESQRIDAFSYYQFDEGTQRESASRGTFQLQCYGRLYTDSGTPVKREIRGPHGRTIWYTDEQLSMPRSERIILNSTNRSSRGNSRSEEMTSTESISLSKATDPRVGKIASYLTDPSWKNALDESFRTESFSKLAEFLESEYEKGYTIYPPPEEIFRALDLCSLPKVRVVIVGQDPYHGAGQGNGLAFSVRVGVRPPPSLQNIFREVIDDVGITAPTHGNLEHWARQGVLLLNTVLTVRQGEANSHSNKGWEEFTDSIIRIINDQCQGVVFLLWGNSAANKAAYVNQSRHAIIRTSHPSPLGATKTNAPFLTSRCFSRVNSLLQEANFNPVDWTVK